MRSTMLIWILVCVMAGCQQPREPNPPSQQPQQAAANALSVLQKLINNENYKAMGFDSVDEVKQVQLAPPLLMYNIALDQLKAYKAGSSADSLLTPSSETIYPVTVNGQVKSSVTVVHKSDGYEPASFGNAAIVKDLSQYRRSQGDFVVRVPALNMYFLGQRVENRLLLTPIVEDPRLKLRSGEAVPADIVLQQLVPIANSYNGLPM